VWHASVSPIGGVPTERNRAQLFAEAEAALSGVGDAALGEWREVGDKAVHIRRRLTPEEAVSVGPVVDLRGTREAASRLWRAQQWLPPALWTMAAEEIERV
jgi:hypothetical protein